MSWRTTVGILLVALAFYLSSGPQPPGPGPNPTPAPVPPTPSKLVKVILAYESSADMTSKQMVVLYSPKLADYLDKKVGKVNWARFDKDVNPDELQEWKEPWRAARAVIKEVPAIVTFDGPSGVASPLPATVEEAIKLVDKHRGEK